MRVLANTSRWVLLAAALLLPLGNARSNPGQSAPTTGEEYEITRSYETSEQTGDGFSSGRSQGHDTIMERVVAIRSNGLELEYDLPDDASAEDRFRQWQLPVRVFRTISGRMQVLNRPDLEARLEKWLKAANWSRDACGRWIFTWNAFRIECDPQSVVKTIEGFDLRSANVRDRAAYQDAEARGSGLLRRAPGRSGGASFSVTLPLDPDIVRRARADTDVVVAEIMQKPVTLDAALVARSKETVAGTVTVTFDTDRHGKVLRRTRVTKTDTKTQDGPSRSRTATEILERTLVSRRSVAR